jgi:hypothetical protein
MSIAANNDAQITKTCMQQYQNSGFGKAVNSMSIGSLIPGWGPNPLEALKEWGLAIIGKGGGGTLATAALNKYNTQTITTVFGETTIASSAGSGLGTLLHTTAAVGGQATGLATGIDVVMHAGCLGAGPTANGTLAPLDTIPNTY